MDAEEALDDITGYQLRMWLAYQELEPVDAEAGLVASTLLNVNRASKDAPYFKPTDLTAFVIEPPAAAQPSRTPEERWNRLKGDLNMLAAASRARREKREREQQAQGQQQATTNFDTNVTADTATPPEPPPQ